MRRGSAKGFNIEQASLTNMLTRSVYTTGSLIPCHRQSSVTLSIITSMALLAPVYRTGMPPIYDVYFLAGDTLAPVRRTKFSARD